MTTGEALKWADVYAVGDTGNSVANALRTLASDVSKLTSELAEARAQITKLKQELDTAKTGAEWMGPAESSPLDYQHYSHKQFADALYNTPRPLPETAGKRERVDLFPIMTWIHEVAVCLTELGRPLPSGLTTEAMSSLEGALNHE
jgi:hypothetical protein